MLTEAQVHLDCLVKTNYFRESLLFGPTVTNYKNNPSVT